jgi:hypothetical protein
MDYISNDHDHNASVAVAAEADRSSERHDIIAQQMWEDYVCICSERDINEGEEEDNDDDDDNNNNV